MPAKLLSGATVQGNLDMTYNNIKEVGWPVDPDDGVSQVYVINQLNSFLPWKQPVKVVATTAVAGLTFDSTFHTLVGSPTWTLDGVLLAVGDRLLLTSQSDAHSNGIWLVQIVDALKTYCERPDDYGGSAAPNGSATFVRAGSQSGTFWLQLPAAPPFWIDLQTAPWVQVGSGGSSPARTTATYTTASLANNATETGTITMAKGYRILHIAIDRAARVRLYGNAASRAADASRLWGVDPAEGVQLPLDYLSTGAVNEDLNWPVDGYNTEAVPSTAIPLAITNTSGLTHTVAVTVTYQGTE